MATVASPVSLLTDPVKFVKLCWPHIRLYDKQVEIMYSVRDNDETIAVAGNQLGKDFITGLIVLWFFCSRSPCHVVTSSAGMKQLERVLWGEMGQFIKTSKYPLPIVVNHLLIRQRGMDGEVDPKSYIIGLVTNEEENLQGHHLPRGRTALENFAGHGIDCDPNLPRTLAVFDEASGIDDRYYNATDTWAHRKLIIGNPLPCTNFFYRGVKEGDILAPDGSRYYRRIIKIKASDSPNVQARKRLVDGIVDYDTYMKRRTLWDKVRQTVGLDAEFYEGAEVRLYPPDWLERAGQLALQDKNDGRNTRIKAYTSMGVDPRFYVRRRQFHGPDKTVLRRTMGIDTAEGGDDTVWTIVDILGILHQHSMQTADTSDISGITIAFMKQFDVNPNDVLFDRGGGGKQHADYLRRQGYDVRTIAFGESPTSAADAQRQPSLTYSNMLRREERETTYTYLNRRAEMYCLLRFELLDPINELGFAIPYELTELRRQLAPLPLLYDPEGRIYLPPKDKPNKNVESKIVTLREMLGCSPDEADSLALAVFGLFNTIGKKKLGKLF